MTGNPEGLASPQPYAGACWECLVASEEPVQHGLLQMHLQRQAAEKPPSGG